MKKSSGFTVVEAVITLAIACLLIGIGSFRLKEYQSKIIFDNSITEFKSVLSQACRIAIIKNTEITIDYDAKQKTMVLTGKEYHRLLTFKTGLKVNTFFDYKISKNGTLKPKQFVFDDGCHRQKVTIQMMWGRIIEKE